MELETWIRENPEDALDIVNRMTGHDIFDPSVLDAMPEQLREGFVSVHKSGNTHKSTIYVGGHAVDQLEGVNGSTVLRRFKHALGVSSKACIGRGFQAKADKKAIRKELQGEPEKVE